MQLTITYKAAPGSHFNDSDAEVIGPELERIPAEERDARTVVERARPEDSPLHRYFEWKDDVAAEKYREGQARYMLRSITSIVVDISGGETEVRAFHPISLTPEATAEPKRYLTIDEVRREHDYADQVIQDARSQLQGWARRFRVYRDILGEEFSPVFEVAEAIEQPIAHPPRDEHTAL